jgi:hypothetical protein
MFAKTPSPAQSQNQLHFPAGTVELLGDLLHGTALVGQGVNLRVTRIE